MKISVLTPSFNSGKYILRAIESVLAQDYKDWEHIVIDGGSQDGTTDILKKYPHLNWESSRDKGQSDAMNKAFKKATGDVIMYLNSDDEFEEGWFTKIVEIFNDRKDIDLVIGKLKISDNGKVSIRTPSSSLNKVLNYWPCKFPLNPVSYAYRRSLQEKIGPFPLDNHYTMDYWFLLRAYLFAEIVKTEFIGGTYYVHEANKSMDASAPNNI